MRNWKQPEINELCRHIAYGLSSAEIAKEMQIPEKVVQDEARWLLNRVIRKREKKKRPYATAYVRRSPEEKKKIMQGIAEGKCYKEIAVAMGLTPDAVRNIVDKMKLKHKATSRLHLIHLLHKANYFVE